MYYVYILKSLKDKRYYIGYTSNLSRRIEDHNRGKSKAIKHRCPFEIVHTEEFKTRIEAIRREKEIKKYKSGEAFKKLLLSSPSSILVYDTPPRRGDRGSKAATGLIYKSR